MKLALVLAIAACLASCRSDVEQGNICLYHGVPFANGATFHELCNDCTCNDGDVECTQAQCPQAIDANPTSCAPSTGCEGFGPQCGSFCCNPGERCVAGQCVCGTGSGNTCDFSDRCGGPATQNGCGELCCGGKGACPQ
jgi:hypothetical protein